MSKDKKEKQDFKFRKTEFPICTKKGNEVAVTLAPHGTIVLRGAKIGTTYHRNWNQVLRALATGPKRSRATKDGLKELVEIEKRREGVVKQAALIISAKCPCCNNPQHINSQQPSKLRTSVLTAQKCARYVHISSSTEKHRTTQVSGYIRALRSR